MTGYTYIPVIVILQVLLGLNNYVIPMITFKSNLLIANMHVL